MTFPLVLSHRTKLNNIPLLEMTSLALSARGEELLLGDWEGPLKYQKILIITQSIGNMMPGVDCNE